METKHADLSSLKIDRSGGEEKIPVGSKKIISIISWVLIIIVVAFAGYYGWNKLFEAGIDVHLTTASNVSTSQTNAVLTASGYVVAQRKASVASKASGRMVYLGVVEGDAVKEGQIIARLDDTDVKAQLEQAKANLVLSESQLQDAKNSLEREKGLLKTGASTQASVDAAQARYNNVMASIEVAKAGIEIAQVNVENTLIRAPFDGTVLTKNADVGEYVTPLGASSTSRAAVVTMADMKSLQVEADVSESNFEKIKPNQDCEITLDAYPEVHYPGYVAKIVPTADRSKATVLVKVAFKDYDSRVLPEMSAKVLFLNAEGTKTIVDSKPMLVVPKTSVVLRDKAQYVFKVNDDKAERVEVTTGKDAGSYVEITSGLSDGDQVIDQVSDNIKDGIKVNVLK